MLSEERGSLYLLIDVDIPCVNRFTQLADECESVDDGEHGSVVFGGKGGDLSVESVSAGKVYRYIGN